MARKRSPMTILFLLISRYESVYQSIRIPPRGHGCRSQKRECHRPQKACRCKRESFEFAARSGLFGANAAGGDVGFEIVFTRLRRVDKAAKHGHLAPVI